MIRRMLGAAALALALGVAVASAAAPAGPRLAVVELSTGKPAQLQLLNVGPGGGSPLRLAGGGFKSRPLPDYFSPLAWSPDGGRVAFSGIVGFRGGDGADPISKLFTVGADGGGRRPVAGTKGASGPVFSPDGRTLAFTRAVQEHAPVTVAGQRWEEGFDGSTIWTVDLLTGARHRLTPWRNGLSWVASSFSPDGTTLLATLEDSRLTYEPQPVALALDGGGLRRLADDGESPVYSPDGTKIALVRRGAGSGTDHVEDLDLYVLNADGTGTRRLTRTRGRPELFPSWDPSGERLAYVRLPRSRGEDAPFGYSSALMQINADGTCATKVRSSRRAYFFAPTWQPGPGRGAGRIEC